ncbi:MAG: hypothetical protein EP343_25560 [Deltaproteobacteria bacterium]|nr:MAG: hypothetical protein EP343_25560 [Deltaproteobacteria bacterium]
MSQTTLEEHCQALEWKDLLRLYARLLREAPEHLDLAARTLRNKARSGEVPEDAIPGLSACLMSAENNSVTVELAKALAAFGSKAEAAAPILVHKMQEMHIQDDVDFWAFDGCLHALGYIGSEEDLDALEEFGEKPPVTRAGDLYKGNMPEEHRLNLFDTSLDIVTERLEAEDAGTWTQRNTDYTSEQEDANNANVPAWRAGML